MAAWIVSLVGADILVINDPSVIGIVLSLVICLVAASNLFVDVEMIRGGVDAGAPKWMEGYGALGLLTTLIRLYIEFLRLVALLRQRTRRTTALNSSAQPRRLVEHPPRDANLDIDEVAGACVQVRIDTQSGPIGQTDAPLGIAFEVLLRRFDRQRLRFHRILAELVVPDAGIWRQ